MNQKARDKLARQMNQLGARVASSRMLRTATKLFDAATEIQGMTTVTEKKLGRIIGVINPLLAHVLLIYLRGRTDHWVGEINSFLKYINDNAFNKAGTKIIFPGRPLVEDHLQDKLPHQKAAVKSKLREEGVRYTNAVKSKLAKMDLTALVKFLLTVDDVDTGLVRKHLMD
jgi:hypothetical protein